LITTGWQLLRITSESGAGWKKLPDKLSDYSRQYAITAAFQHAYLISDHQPGF